MNGNDSEMPHTTSYIDPKQLSMLGEDSVPMLVERAIVGLLRKNQQPSAWEILKLVERQVGAQGRWELLATVKRMRNDHIWTQAIREYLNSLIESGSLAEALRGEGAPDHSIVSSIDLLVKQSANYRQSAAFQEMIDFMGRFRSYSPYNNMLVKIQNPSCGFYATARDWQVRFGRQIKEDARPMLILAPMYPVMLVYDLDQTEGDTLPAELEDFGRFQGDWQGLWLGRMVENAKGYRIQVDFKTLSSSNAGFATRVYESKP